MAQVAPAVKIGGLPLGIGGGISDYSVDYGPGRRMIGASAWLDYSLFHGLGITAVGTSIFADKPDSLQRMRQDTIKGGAVYKYRPIFRVRPEVKGLIGTGSIDFPSHTTYTHDTYMVYSLEGGGEYRVWNNVFAHGDYEYQWWPGYHGHGTLNPSGFTFGATYYLRGVHRHY
jgi:hypothetical protein